MVPSIRALVLRLMDAVPSATRFYDVNLRPDCHTPELVESLLARSHVVKLSDDEAAVLGPMLGVAHDPLPRFCEVLARRLGLRAVCVTQGALGASMWREGEFSVAPGEPVEVVDTVGAGDAFAAALVAGLDAGWPSDRVLREANRQGARVAAQAGAVS
jgi:fructokinase